MRILMVGDVIGRPGRRAVRALVPQLRQQYSIDLVIANGENAAGGIGLTPETAGELLKSGVDVITSGNHIWHHKDVLDYIDEVSCPVLRPANYPPGNPGKGFIILRKEDVRILVINLQGRLFIPMALDCPFRTVDTILRNNPADVIIVEMHAEATSEKQALAQHLDGKATIVAGTHTHVLTADARTLPGGTACITDLGMCGSIDGVIGMNTEEARLRFLTGRHIRLKVAEGNTYVNGLEVVLDGELNVDGLRTINEKI